MDFHDPDVLAVAAREGRILVSHDFGTMPRHFRDFSARQFNTLFSCSTYLTTDQTHDHWFNNKQSCYKGYPNSYYLRTMPDRFPWLRQMDDMTTNLSIAKTFQVTERWRFNLRGEAFNLMNHPLFGAPDTTYTDARFGMLPLGQQNFPRLVQISAKLLF